MNVRTIEPQPTEALPATVSPLIRVAVRAGVEFVADQASLRVTHRWGSRTVGVGSVAVANALAGLHAQPESLLSLSEQVGAQGGPSALGHVSALNLVVRAFSDQGLIDWVVTEPSAPWARLTGEGVLGVWPRRAPGGELTTQRHTVIVPADDGTVCLQHAGLHQRLLLSPQSLPGLLGSAVERSDDPGWSAVVDLAWSAGLLRARDEPEPTSAKLWSVPELWMHARSRDSRAVDRYGGTYPMQDEMAPPPFNRPPSRPIERVRLPACDLRACSLADTSLTDAMENRKSIREFSSEHDPTVEQLAEVLYRTVRTRRLFTAEHDLQVADKPVPAGGSIHEIDLYVVVSRCTGLTPGLWRYDSVEHALDLVTADGREVARLVSDAQTTARTADPPPLVFLLAASFDRINWKYQTIGYSLVLKHVGAIFEALYLVCPSVGLGVCGLGGGSTSSFAAATGADPLLLGTVGELVLGVPR